MWRSKATRKCGNTANGSRSSPAKAAAPPSRRSDCRRITHATAVSGTTGTMTCCSARSGVVPDTKKASLCSKLTVKRGDIFYADLSGTIGSEQGGIRPVLVVQNDVEISIVPPSSLPRFPLPESTICRYISALGKAADFQEIPLFFWNRSARLTASVSGIMWEHWTKK